MASLRPAVWLAFLGCCQGSAGEFAPTAPTAAVAPAPAIEPVHGRIEEYQGLRIVRLWGTPEQRGRAHGLLLGKDIAACAGAEFGKRFARKPALLATARKSLDRNIAWPEAVRRE